MSSLDEQFKKVVLGGIFFSPLNPTEADKQYVGLPIDLSTGRPVGMPPSKTKEELLRENIHKEWNW